MSNQPYLVLFDADNIAGYVFDTGRLKEIRGGSFLVREATRPEVIQQLAQACDNGAQVIYTGGGAGMVKFSTQAPATQFVTSLQRHFREKTVGGTLSAVSVPYASSFAATVQQGHLALRQRKSGVPQRDRQFIANPYTAICVSCGHRPVTKIYQTAPDRREALCAMCLKRRTCDDELHAAAQQAQTTQAHDRLHSVTFGDQAAANDPFATAINAHNRNWHSVWLPDELDDIGKLARPLNYIGFLHADGNRMGEHLRAFLDNLAGQNLTIEMQEVRYGQFSQAIADATLEATVAALSRAFPNPTDWYAPFDNVLMAGDDLILVVAAHKALDVAVAFCQEFEQRIGAKAAALGYHELITTAVGVVLANANQPILYLQHQAKELYGKAKKLSAQRRATTGEESTIDFTVVTTPVLRSLKDIRRQEYTRQDDADQLILTRRPYTVTDLAALLAWGRKLKGLEAPPNHAPVDADRRTYPRNQLNRLYDAIFQGYYPAALQGARALLRVNHYQRTLLQGFAERFNSNKPPPWGDDSATAFTDLVEIYDFLQDLGDPLTPLSREEVAHG